eukprot:scaffold130181_cov58-Cyclotella_meneghiniana.AAC.1
MRLTTPKLSLSQLVLVLGCWLLLLVVGCCCLLLVVACCPPWRMRAPAERAERPNKCATRRNRQNRAKQGGTRQNKGGTHWIEAEQKGYLGEHYGERFVLSDGRNTAEQGRTKAEQGGTKPNKTEQAEQGKTKAELFRPLCAQGPYPPVVCCCVLLRPSGRSKGHYIDTGHPNS